MADRGFSRAQGVGAGGAMHDAVASLANGDTYDTGLRSLETAVIQARNVDAGTDDLVVYGPDLAASTGGVLQVWAATPDGTSTGVAEADARDCVVIAFGE